MFRLSFLFFFPLRLAAFSSTSAQSIKNMRAMKTITSELKGSAHARKCDTFKKFASDAAAHPFASASDSESSWIALRLFEPAGLASDASERDELDEKVPERLIWARTAAADLLSVTSAWFGAGGTSTSSVIVPLGAGSGSRLEPPGSFGALDVFVVSRRRFGDRSTASGRGKAPTRCGSCSAPPQLLVRGALLNCNVVRQPG